MKDQLPSKGMLNYSKTGPNEFWQTQYPHALAEAGAANTDIAKPAANPTRYSRRLSDKILISFHHACDQVNYEIAWQLLAIFESMVSRRPAQDEQNPRRNIENLVAAHERLWHLRHPEQDYG